MPAAEFGKRDVMQTRVQCPTCKASFEVPAALVGRDGECSRCGNVFRVTPLSGEVDPSVLTSGDSNATLEMPVIDDNRSAADTDEFEIPDIPASPVDSTDSNAPMSKTPELEIPELELLELDIPASSISVSKKKKKSESAAEVPALDDVHYAPAEELPPSILIDDDGSLFGDEIPELEDVREPVSRYASEDEFDPDAGGSYSLAGSSPSPKKQKAEQARRKKAARKKATSKRRGRATSAEGDSRATSDHDLEVDEVQLFDDVLHDDNVLHDEEDDRAGPNSSPIMLRRSGSFPTAGKPTLDKSSTRKSSGKGGKSHASAGREPEKPAKRRAPARSEGSDSDGGRHSSKPILKRRSSEGRPSPSLAKSDISAAPGPRKKSPQISPESRQKLIMIVGGGAVLLLLGTAFSYLTSGPPVITPTAQSGTGNSIASQPSGTAPVPNQGGDSIQTGDTTSSVERANRIRTAPGPPRRIDNTAGRTKNDADAAVAADAATGEATHPTGTSSTENGTPDRQLPENPTTIARPSALPAGAQAIVPDRGSSDSAGNFQTDDDELFSVETVAIPTFPDLGRPRASTISGVVFHEIAVGGLSRKQAPDDDALPGSRMDMILYLPRGTHERGSLPCVMIAAAGTTLLEGNGCYDESYQSETIPYVQNGFAVLGYSLDGPLASDEPSTMESRTAYEQFRAAHAGLVNSRNAMEFLVQKVPAINRDRIFTAGHSSAGTLSLLFAEHESRLAGCVAYAPCVDVEKRLSEYVSNPLVEVLLPEVRLFVRQGSPQRHFQSLKCPVFLFHAEGDTNAPFDESRKLSERLNAQGTSCQLDSVPDGDHYNSMLETGIPRAIVWLKNTAAQTPTNSNEPSKPAPK